MKQARVHCGIQHMRSRYTLFMCNLYKGTIIFASNSVDGFYTKTVSTAYMNGHWGVLMLLDGLHFSKDLASMFGSEL
jgi:hypothetical protein